jgi:hypothetical protein
MALLYLTGYTKLAHIPERHRQADRLLSLLLLAGKAIWAPPGGQASRFTA